MPSLREIAGMMLIFFAAFGLTLGCGGGSSDGGGGGGGGGGGTGGTGPSGATCTNYGACFSNPPGTMAMSCPASVGASPAVQAGDYDHVLNSINTIRTNIGLNAVVRTAGLDAFANQATIAISLGGAPHAYFSANAAGDPAFGTGFSENQTAPSWTPNNTTTQIDEIMACFMSEEDDPVGFQKGHWESIVCPCVTKIGVGLVKNAAGELFMTIDFSN